MKHRLSSFIVAASLFSVSRGYTQNMDKYIRLMDVDSADVVVQSFFSYDFSKSDVINFGGISLATKDFHFKVVKVKDLYTFKEQAEDKFLNQNVLLVNYPKNIMAARNLNIEIVSGQKETKVFWNDESRDDLKHFIDEVDLYGGVPKSTADLVNGRLAADLVIPVEAELADIGDSQAGATKKGKLSFCVNQQDSGNDSLYMKMCWSNDDKHAAVRINNVEQVIVGEKPVTHDEIFQFEGELKNLTLAFKAKLPKVNILEVVPYGKNQIKIMGAGPLPVADARYMENQSAQLLSQIKASENSWVSILPQSKAKLYFTGVGGGIFGLNIEASSYAQDKYLFLLSDDLKPTYLSKKVLHGKKSHQLQLESKSGVIVNSSASEKGLLTSFELEAELNNKDSANIVDLAAVSESGQKYSYKVRLDRAYSSGLSLRLMGGQLESQSSAFEGQFLPYGGLSGYYWFEDFLFIHNSFFTQRFGVTARYISALKKYEMPGPPISENQMSQQKLGLRMRFESGIYGQEPGGGLSLNYQNLVLAEQSYPSAGIGFFWALPMPGFLDEAIDTLFMQYPKWLDIEMIYYPVSLKSDVKLKSMYELNLTSKLVIDTDYFSEIGLSYEKFDFEVANSSQQLSNTSILLGVGVQF